MELKSRRCSKCGGAIISRNVQTLPPEANSPQEVAEAVWMRRSARNAEPRFLDEAGFGVLARKLARRPDCLPLLLGASLLLVAAFAAHFLGIDGAAALRTTAALQFHDKLCPGASLHSGVPVTLVWGNLESSQSTRSARPPQGVGVRRRLRQPQGDGGTPFRGRASHWWLPLCGELQGWRCVDYADRAISHVKLPGPGPGNI